MVFYTRSANSAASCYMSRGNRGRNSDHRMNGNSADVICVPWSVYFHDHFCFKQQRWQLRSLTQKRYRDVKTSIHWENDVYVIDCQTVFSITTHCCWMERVPEIIKLTTKAYEKQLRLRYYINGSCQFVLFLYLAGQWLPGRLLKMAVPFEYYRFDWAFFI